MRISTLVLACTLAMSASAFAGNKATATKAKGEATSCAEHKNCNCKDKAKECKDHKHCEENGCTGDQHSH